MAATSTIVKRSRDTLPLAVVRRYEEWGLLSLDLAGPPRRFWADGEPPPAPIVDMGIDAERVEVAPTPSQLLGSLPDGDTWTSLTRRSIARLRAYFLLSEDPQRRLDALGPVGVPVISRAEVLPIFRRP